MRWFFSFYFFSFFFLFNPIVLFIHHTQSRVLYCTNECHSKTGQDVFADEKRASLTLCFAGPNSACESIIEFHQAPSAQAAFLLFATIALPMSESARARVLAVTLFYSPFSSKCLLHTHLPCMRTRGVELMGVEWTQRKTSTTTLFARAAVRLFLAPFRPGLRTLPLNTRSPPCHHHNCCARPNHTPLWPSRWRRRSRRHSSATHSRGWWRPRRTGSMDAACWRTALCT